MTTLPEEQIIIDLLIKIDEEKSYHVKDKLCHKLGEIATLPETDLHLLRKIIDAVLEKEIFVVLYYVTDRQDLPEDIQLRLANTGRKILSKNLTTNQATTSKTLERIVSNDWFKTRNNHTIDLILNHQNCSASLRAKLHEMQKIQMLQ